MKKRNKYIAFLLVALQLFNILPTNRVNAEENTSDVIVENSASGGDAYVSTDTVSGNDLEVLTIDNPDAGIAVIAEEDLETVADATYEVLEGSSAEWVMGSETTLKFRVDADFNSFTGVVIDGIEVSSDNYSAYEGSTVVELNSDYLNNLSEGNHTLTMNFSSGTNVDINFSVGAQAEEECIELSNSYATARFYEASGKLVVTEFLENANCINQFYPWNDYKDSITSVEFENTVTFIGDGAFNGYHNLTGNLIIPDSVTKIGVYAFQFCSGLTGNLVIPNSVTEIGHSAFSGCSGFDGTLTLSNSLTKIQYYTFNGCSGFTGDLVIPDSVTEIITEAFQNCSGFNGTLTLSDNLTSIEGYAFNGCSGFTGDLVIPDSVTTLGKSDNWQNPGGTFKDCSGFNGTLTLSNNLTCINNSDFECCTGLTGSLVIPNSVTEIGMYAFYWCEGFDGTLTLSNQLTTINQATFMGCANLSGKLVIPDSVTYIDTNAFSGCSSFSDMVSLSNNLTFIGNKAFYSCTGMSGELFIPDSVVTIKNEPFAFVDELSTISGGKNLSSVGAEVFHCSSGKNVKTTLISTNQALLDYDWTNDNRYFYDITVIDVVNNKEDERTTVKAPLNYEYSYSALTLDGYTVVGEKTYAGVATSDLTIKFYYETEAPIQSTVNITNQTNYSADLTTTATYTIEHEEDVTEVSFNISDMIAELEAEVGSDITIDTAYITLPNVSTWQDIIAGGNGKSYGVEDSKSRLMRYYHMNFDAATEDVTFTLDYNSNYPMSSNAVDYEAVALDMSEINIKLSWSISPKLNVTVKYVDIETNEEIADSETFSFAEVGQSSNVLDKAVSGYVSVTAQKTSYTSVDYDEDASSKWYRIPSGAYSYAGQLTNNLTLVFEYTKNAVEVKEYEITVIEKYIVETVTPAVDVSFGGYIADGFTVQQAKGKSIYTVSRVVRCIDSYSEGAAYEYLAEVPEGFKVISAEEYKGVVNGDATLEFIYVTKDTKDIPEEVLEEEPEPYIPFAEEPRTGDGDTSFPYAVVVLPIAVAIYFCRKKKIQ